MNTMIMTMLMIMTILLVLMMLITMVSKKSFTNTQKLTPFECGFNPVSHSRLPFSIHFFMIAVIFLIFDIEIVMIMPMILTMKTSMIEFWMKTSTIFVMILLVGLFHEWSNGMIDWTK